MAENGRESHETHESGHGAQISHLTPHQREKTQPLEKGSSGTERFRMFHCFDFVWTDNHKDFCLHSFSWSVIFNLIQNYLSIYFRNISSCSGP
jgi:hypothetical protein